MSGNKKYIILGDQKVSISDVLADCGIKLPVKVKKGESLVSILEKLAAYFQNKPDTPLTQQEIEAIARTINNIYVTDYDKDITGERNGINKIYKLRYNYVTGSTEVYLGGLRLQPGVNYDYLESGGNTITINYPPDLDQNLLIKYIKSV